MNDPSNADIETSVPEHETSRARGERVAAGVALRVDSPHAQPGFPTVPDAALEPAAVRNFPARHVSINPDSGMDVRLVAPVARAAGAVEGDDRFALETGQIAAHLRQQYADLDRREQRLHAQLAQVDQERREQRMWVAELESGLEEREIAIAKQEAVLSQRANDCLKLETELKELHESLLRERHTLNVERDHFIQDREEQTKAVESLQARQYGELERLRADLIAEHDAAEVELKQRSVLLDNRHRFQQEHLERTMHEFEAVQNAFRHEQQVARTRDEETRGQNLLRSGQLERQRELLDERQQSIERERQVLSKERRALEERLSVDSENLRREQAAWELDRDTQKADLRRQQDMLALHAENLETRRQRLDRLRAELEETNRQTLELRLAVEESAAQLMQTAGSEVTQQRIDEARAVLAEYYRHTRESLIRQHQELEQAQVRIEEQREGFRTERQTLVEWVTQQEAQLAAREQAQRAERAALAQRDAELRTAVELMTAEKLQSESTIRDLLQQLSAREAGSEKT
ncbi:MAG TPA: hypothetical protein VGM05_08910 [Planctomycetaceae bacterium]|jgi:hypothetical protein